MAYCGTAEAILRQRLPSGPARVLVTPSPHCHSSGMPARGWSKVPFSSRPRAADAGRQSSVADKRRSTDGWMLTGALSVRTNARSQEEPEVTTTNERILISWERGVHQELNG